MIWQQKLSVNSSRCLSQRFFNNALQTFLLPLQADVFRSTEADSRLYFVDQSFGVCYLPFFFLCWYDTYQHSPCQWGDKPDVAFAFSLRFTFTRCSGRWSVVTSFSCFRMLVSGVQDCFWCIMTAWCESDAIKTDTIT